MNIFEKVFEKELKLIVNNEFRQDLIDLCSTVDPYNFVGPASSSGKYHSTEDNKIGGLVHHTKAVLKILLRMMESMPKFDDSKEKDIMIGAALLHDLCKYDGKSDHTIFEHPALMKEKIDNFYGGIIFKDDVVSEMMSKMASCIAAHSSRWNTSKYSKVILEVPTKIDQVLLSLADMVASDKDVNININE